MSPGPRTMFSPPSTVAHSTTRRFSNQRHGCGGTLAVPLTPRTPPMLISRGSRSLLLRQQRGSSAARSPLVAASLMMTRWSLNLANSCRAPSPPSSSRSYSLPPLSLSSSSTSSSTLSSSCPLILLPARLDRPEGTAFERDTSDEKNIAASCGGYASVVIRRIAV